MEGPGAFSGPDGAAARYNRRMATGPVVFDRRLVRARRDRAAPRFHERDFLVRAAAARLADRLLDLDREFAVALDLGCHAGAMAEAWPEGRARPFLVQADLSPAMARRAARNGPALACDEEALPFADGALDAVLSCLSLHWVNDLPGALAQIRRALKPDGLFMASMAGGGTLAELRAVLAEAEMEVAGGASPRVSPFADLPDLGGLLQRAGFALPVVDSDTIDVTYADLFALMADLRGMAEANATVERRRRPTRREVFPRAAELYRARHGAEDGRVPATFRILTMTGWAPAPSQQKPLRPGAARTRLAAALGAEEVGAGEAAGGGGRP